MGESSISEMKIIPGMIGAQGIRVGKAFIHNRAKFSVPKRYIPDDRIQSEVKRFKDARQNSLDQLHKALVKVSRRDHRIIIESHMMLTADEVLFEDVQDLIEQEKITAEWAVSKVIEEVIKPLNEQDIQYLKERRTDLEHVSSRLIRNLLGIIPRSLESLTEPAIVVSHDISPADMAHVKREYVLGIITETGGSTGHVSILARGMNIPTLVGVEDVASEIRSGSPIILDAIDGKVILRPTPEIVEEFLNKKKIFEAERVELLKLKDLPSVTRDNHEVTISANIEFPDEIPVVLDHGIHSIGLFRTEFVYITSQRIPNEKDQYQIYKQVAEKIGVENPVTVRTLDLGADKILPGFFHEKEANPALGSRAIRFSLNRPDIFKVQLRAILRASVHGKLKIMFPMISGLGEVRQAKSILEEVKNELRQNDVPFDENIKVGIMMEVPSAALIADVLAKEVDFFSIGTNDLIQYMLAVDRINENVNYLYTPLHPSVLRVIDEVVRKGHEGGIKVSMCGEMAGEIHYLMLLVGLGLDELSMPVASTLKIKWFLRNISYSECKQFAKNILSLTYSADVENYLHDQMSCRFPEIFPASFWKRH